MAFLDDNYLLGSDTAVSLYNEIKNLPVVDAHNHSDVAEIAVNNNYSNAWQVVAATDHYVWEMMRKRGIDERYITGDAAPEEKWLKLCSIFPEIVGNPVYEWVHLDLRRGLGLTDALISPETGKELWGKINAALAMPEKRPQQLLKAMNVEVMCSTDDPADVIENHDKVNAAAGKIQVRPTWRPDKAVNIFSPAWKAYIKRLGDRYSTEIKSVDELVEVLQKSHDYFAEKGCVASDHGIEYPLSGDTTRETAQNVFRKAMAGETLTRAEIDDYMSYLTVQIAEMDAKSGWVFQMHIGAVRDIRDYLMDNLGPDSGGDVSDHMIDIVKPLGKFLNKFDNRLKVALYCLEAGHQASLATVARAFGANVRLGSAWWLNDSPIGMRRQLEYIGSVDLFYNFAGMVSDSRKILSYGSRFEMFRRILADVTAQHVLRGQMPMECAVNMVKHMSYYGPKAFYAL
ncbi:MAG: glucuronate isomerase [Lentisphaeria bacterium]|nr:glucuronate isomerase [Lentisphaeria bacterium]